MLIAWQKLYTTSPPDIRAELQESDPARLILIEEATKDFKDELIQAAHDVNNTPTGSSALGQAVSQSPDNTIYIFVDPTIKHSSAAFQSPDGHKGIIIQPCEGVSQYLTEDGDYSNYGLSRIIAHEATHIANGDTNDRLFGPSTEKMERRAIGNANKIALEDDPNNPTRDVDSHDHNSEKTTITDPGQCSPSTLTPGF